MQDNRYQVMPDLTSDEFAALKADIAARGVQVPIELDENGNVLDGHHRLRACAELGITEYPTITREGMTEDEKVMHAYRLNTARRHLTPTQTRMAVAEALRRFPDRSNREIAAIMGISHPTVGKYRSQLEASGQVVSVTTRTGADGKEYPVRDHRGSTADVQDALTAVTTTAHPLAIEPPYYISSVHTLRNMRETIDGMCAELNKMSTELDRMLDAAYDADELSDDDRGGLMSAIEDVDSEVCCSVYDFRHSVLTAIDAALDAFKRLPMSE